MILTVHRPHDKTLAQDFEDMMALADLKQTEFENLSDYIRSTDFLDAPASTRYHLCVPHGLVCHTLNGVEAALALNSMFLLETTSVVKVALLHDLCKVDFYKEYHKNVKRYLSPLDYESYASGEDKDGRFYWGKDRGYLVDEQFCYGHGEKSVLIAQSLGINLTLLEAQAIRYHMGDFTKNPETSRVYSDNPLALLLHMADLYASSKLDMSAEACKNINILE